MQKVFKYFKNTTLLFLVSTVAYKYYTNPRIQRRTEKDVLYHLEFWETFLKHNKPN